MVRIFADTSTLYNTAQAREAGFSVSPLSVTIAGQTYREFDDIEPEAFTALIRQGHLPTSSQPAIGEVAALYEQYPEDEILNITMADGLSGTYASAVAAAELCSAPGRITVLNSRTLCGPHRYLVENAVRLAAKGLTLPAIVRRTEELMRTAKSFLVPADFAYLRRGGRLSPLVSYVGQAARLTPLITPTEDGRQLTLAGIRRSFLQAVEQTAKAFTAHGVGEGWRIYITHADAQHLADQAAKLLGKVFPAVVVEILPLSPVFITQGGPGCVAIQAIHS